MQDLIIQALLAGSTTLNLLCIMKMRRMRAEASKRAVQSDLNAQRLRGLSLSYARSSGRVEALSDALEEVSAIADDCYVVPSTRVIEIAKRGLDRAGL